MSPVKRICVFEHSVMTIFNCACPAIQRGQGFGFLSEGSSWLTACMSEQRRFWRGSPEPSLLAYVISTLFAWRGPNNALFLPQVCCGFANGSRYRHVNFKVRQVSPQNRLFSRRWLFVKHKLSHILHRIHILKAYNCIRNCFGYSEVGVMSKLVVDTETFWRRFTC